MIVSFFLFFFTITQSIQEKLKITSYMQALIKWVIINQKVLKIEQEGVNSHQIQNTFSIVNKQTIFHKLSSNTKNFTILLQTILSTVILIIVFWNFKTNWRAEKQMRGTLAEATKIPSSKLLSPETQSLPNKQISKKADYNSQHQNYYHSARSKKKKKEKCYYGFSRF